MAGAAHSRGDPTRGDQRLAGESEMLESEDAAVPRKERLERAARGDAVATDVRPALEYAHGHLSSAISMPVETLPARLGELSKE